jgi:hypothetical protein
MSEEITDADLERIEFFAKSATPGPWLVVYRVDDGGREDIMAENGCTRVARCMGTPEMGCGEDARYLASVSPDKTLALIERLRRAEAALRRPTEVDA